MVDLGKLTLGIRRRQTSGLMHLTPMIDSANARHLQLSHTSASASASASGSARTPIATQVRPFRHYFNYESLALATILLLYLDIFKGQETGHSGTIAGTSLPRTAQPHFSLMEGF